MGAVLLTQVGKDSAMVPIEIPTPAQDELVDFGQTRVFFGHQSVGANVISGVQAVFAEAGAPAPVVLETRDAAAARGGFLAHAYVGVNGDPLGKLADFTSALSGPMGDQVDVAVLKFCYVDVVAGTDVQALFDAYSRTMTELEASHPGIRFLYTTVPLTTDWSWKQVLKSWIGQDDQMGPADNVARERYNRLIRERYGSSGRLFDIAAVEATMVQDPMSRKDGDQTYYVLNSRLASDAGHLNELGQRAAAVAFIDAVTLR